MGGVFVGRTAELDLLAEVLARARIGPTAAIVVGEAGSGKSTLLMEARSRFAARHCFDVVGYEPEQRVALSAAASLLRAVAEVPIDGEPLRALLLRPEHDSALEPMRIFEAAYRSFRTLEPVLLVIDDLQWMDERSFALCHYLVRAGCESGQRIAVFAATRPGERGGELGELLPPERVTHIALPPLTRDEGVELAAAIDPGTDPIRAEELWERAGGSPFWLDALVRAGGTTRGLADLLTVRMRGTSSDASALLGLLAVAGRPFLLVKAAAALDWPESRADAAMAELVTRGVTVTRGGASRLAHDLVRDAALTELSSEVKKELHRRLAARIEGDAGATVQPLLEALEHRRAAGMPTADLARRLAGSPARALLGKRGLGLLAGIVDESDPLDPGTLSLEENVATLATELAEHELALLRWTLVGERALDPLQQSSAFLAASKSAYALGRLREARAFLARSREIGAQGEAPLELEQDTHEAAIRLWLEWRTADGRALIGDVVSAARDMVAERGRVEHLPTRARRAYLDALRLDYEGAMQEGDADAVLRAAGALEEAARGFELEAVLAASLAGGVGLYLTGRLTEAAVRFRTLWAEAHRRVLPGLTVDAGWWLADALGQAGDLVGAEQVIAEVAELAVRVGDIARARHRVALSECHVALQRGRPFDVLRRLEREAAAEPNDHYRIAFLRDVAVWHARLEGAAASEFVLQALGEARACSGTVGCPRCTRELEIASAEALARIGLRAEARRVLARKADGQRDPGRQRLMLRHAAALANDEASGRAQRLREVLPTEDTEFELIRLWVRLDLGRALAEHSGEDAISVLGEVATRSAESGAGTVQELAEQALRALGVRTWRRGAAGAPLTAREEEVALLVSEGATNREIARTIFLSPKTVERHVSNAMKKLGARNRAELAARVHDAGARYAGNAR